MRIILPARTAATVAALILVNSPAMADGKQWSCTATVAGTAHTMTVQSPDHVGALATFVAELLASNTITPQQSNLASCTQVN